MPFPDHDLAVTNILVVSDIARSRAWYLDVLGATLYGEYGGTSVVLQLGTSWLLLVSGGGPTDDKPGVSLAPPADPAVMDHLITMRVGDCQAVYEELLGRGAEFLTAPITNGPETRCFFLDPDGHLFEISEYRGSGPARQRVAELTLPLFDSGQTDLASRSEADLAAVLEAGSVTMPLPDQWKRGFWGGPMPDWAAIVREQRSEH